MFYVSLIQDALNSLPPRLRHPDRAIYGDWSESLYFNYTQILIVTSTFLLMYKYKFLTKLTEIPNKTAKQTKRALIKIAHFYTLIHNFIHTYSLILYIYSLYFLLQIVNFCINIQKVIHFSTFLDKLSTLKCKTNFLHLPF